MQQTWLEFKFRSPIFLSTVTIMLFAHPMIQYNLLIVIINPSFFFLQNYFNLTKKSKILLLYLKLFTFYIFPGFLFSSLGSLCSCQLKLLIWKSNYEKIYSEIALGSHQLHYNQDPKSSISNFSASQALWTVQMVKPSELFKWPRPANCPHGQPKSYVLSLKAIFYK